MYCRNCGKKLGAEVRFCDRCGTPQGAAAGQELPKPEKPSMFTTLIRECFKDPTGAVRMAAEKRCFGQGSVFFLLKDIFLALLIALLRERFPEYYLPDGLIDKPFVLAAVIFSLAVCLDFIWIVMLFIGGKVSGGKGKFSAFLAGCGTSNLMFAVGWVFAVVLSVFSEMTGALFVYGLIGAGAISANIVLTEAMKASKGKSFYAAALIMIVYLFVLVYVEEFSGTLIDKFYNG